jgi:hypothetical protein
MILIRLFIGGPLDGKRIAIETNCDTYTTATEYGSIPFVDYGTSDSEPEAIAIQTHIYAKMQLVGDIIIMAHSSLSLEGVAAILVEGYKK